jgi:hypothetical protein
MSSTDAHNSNLWFTQHGVYDLNSRQAPLLQGTIAWTYIAQEEIARERRFMVVVSNPIAC